MVSDYLKAQNKFLLLTQPLNYNLEALNIGETETSPPVNKYSDFAKLTNETTSKLNTLIIKHADNQRLSNAHHGFKRKIEDRIYGLNLLKSYTDTLLKQLIEVKGDQKKKDEYPEKSLDIENTINHIDRVEKLDRVSDLQFESLITIKDTLESVIGSITSTQESFIDDDQSEGSDIDIVQSVFTWRAGSDDFYRFIDDLLSIGCIKTSQEAIQDFINLFYISGDRQSTDWETLLKSNPRCLNQDLLKVKWTHSKVDFCRFIVLLDNRGLIYRPADNGLTNASRNVLKCVRFSHGGKKSANPIEMLAKTFSKIISEDDLIDQWDSPIKDMIDKLIQDKQAES